jgi:hypothetical protein
MEYIFVVELETFLERGNEIEVEFKTGTEKKGL